MNDKLTSHVLELKNEIESNSEDLSHLTLGAIDEINQNLHSIILRLNNIRNSKLGINKLHLDILYNIFTSAVYDSSVPETTALDISHVCRHWRKFALGSPTLWAFVDLNKPTSLIDLFMGRSQNAPLALLWKRELVWGQHCVEFDRISSKSYFLSHANLIISRLWSLTIKCTYSDFNQFHHVIHSSGLPPLQLRHLDISLTGDFVDDPLEDHQKFMDSVDTSHLQEIKLIGLDLVWVEPPHNKLTHFTLAYPNPPTLSQLLVFLSNCPVLQVLDLAFRDKNDQSETTSTITAPTNPLTINELVLNLTTLRLSAQGPSSYDLIRQLSERIQITKSLSQFELYCDARPRISPFQIFEAVPSGISSRLANQEYLSIAMIGRTELLEICASAGYHSHESSLSPCRSCPIVIRCEGFHVNESAVLELIRRMPQIKHLNLRFHAWTIFTTQSLDMCSLFPSLHFLELTGGDTATLKWLLANLKFKILILDATLDCHEYYDFEDVADLILRTGVKVLELGIESLTLKTYSIGGC